MVKLSMEKLPMSPALPSRGHLVGDICSVGHKEAKRDGWAGGGPHRASFLCISDVGTSLSVSVLLLELVIPFQVRSVAGG